MTWQNKIGFLITVLICTAGLVPKVREYLNKMPAAAGFDKFWQKTGSKYYSLYVALFMIIGAGVRLWKFGIIPAGFNQDGAMGAVDALALAQYGTDRFGMKLPVHFTAWGFAQMNVLLSYLSVPFIALYGLNRFTARVPVLIISIIALWVIYALSKLLFGRNAALVVLLFCAINPWHIMQSRWALESNMLPHFFLFSVYFLCAALKNNKRFLYLSMVFFGLTMYAYGIAWYAVPLFLCISAVYLFISKRLTFKELILAAITYMLVAWPIFGAMIVNMFKIPTISTPLFTIPFFQDTVRKGDILLFSKNFSNQLINNLKATINVAILQKPDLPWNSIKEYGVIYLFSAPFFIVGLIILLQNVRKNNLFKSEINSKPAAHITKKKARELEKHKIGQIKKSEQENKNLYVLIIIWLITAVISGLIINNVNVNRINIILYPLFILCGLGIYYISSRVKLLGAVILLTYVIAFTGFNLSYFGDHSKVIGTAFYDGFGEALEYIKDKDVDVIYVTNYTQSEKSWWVSEPLTLFHHQIDALYYQGKADAFSLSGKKLLPYKERYKYVNIKDLKIVSGQKAAYIVNNNEISKFDKNAFKIMNFAGYNAVLPVK